MDEQRVGSVDRFERSIVFRVARGYFFFSAMLGVVAVIGGIGAFAMGIVRVPPASPVEPAPIPPPPALSLADVQAWMKEEAASKTVAASPSAIYEAPSDPKNRHGDEPDPTQAEILRLSGELKALFPDPPYVWDDVYREYCARPTSFGCLERGRRLEREGVAKAVRREFNQLSGAHEVLAALHMLLPILAQAPVEQRVSLLGPILATDRITHAEYRRKVREREREIERAKAAHDEAVREQEASKKVFREYGLYGALGGLGLLILVSIFLAHFAIERHLRALHELTAALDKRTSA